VVAFRGPRAEAQLMVFLEGHFILYDCACSVARQQHILYLSLVCSWSSWKANLNHTTMYCGYCMSWIPIHWFISLLSWLPARKATAQRADLCQEHPCMLCLYCMMCSGLPRRPGAEKVYEAVHCIQLTDPKHCMYHDTLAFREDHEQSRNTVRTIIA
jgi:hypothetical protein